MVIAHPPSVESAALGASIQHYKQHNAFESFSGSSLLLQLIWEFPLVPELLSRVARLFSSDFALLVMGILLQAGVFLWGVYQNLREEFIGALLGAYFTLAWIAPGVFYFSYTNIFVFFSLIALIAYSDRYPKTGRRYVLWLALLGSYLLNLWGGLTLTTAYLSFLLVDLLLLRKFYWGKFFRGHFLVFWGLLPMIWWLLRSGRGFLLSAFRERLDSVGEGLSLHTVITGQSFSSLAMTMAEGMGIESSALNQSLLFYPLIGLSLALLGVFFIVSKRASLQDKDYPVWNFLWIHLLWLWITLYALYLFKIDVNFLWAFVVAELLVAFIYIGKSFFMFERKRWQQIRAIFSIGLLGALVGVGLFVSPQSHTGLRFRELAKSLEGSPVTCTVQLEQGLVSSQKRQAYRAWYLGERSLEEIEEALPARIAVPDDKIYWDPAQQKLWAGDQCKTF